MGKQAMLQCVESQCGRVFCHTSGRFPMHLGHAVMAGAESVGNHLCNVAQSAGAVEYTDCTSADPPPNECPYMTLSNLMVSFQ